MGSARGKQPGATTRVDAPATPTPAAPTRRKPTINQSWDGVESVRLSANIDPDTHERIAIHADESGLTYGEILTALIEEHVPRYAPRKVIAKAEARP